MIKLIGGPFEGREVEKATCNIEVKRGDKFLNAVYISGEFVGYRELHESEPTTGVEKPEVEVVKKKDESGENENQTPPESLGFFR